jgi:hypothetical protein
MTDIATTGLNSMAADALVLCSEIDFTASLKPYISLELYIASLGSAPAAGAYFDGWFLYALDGTNYEDGGTSVTPARPADFLIPVRAASTAQQLRPTAATFLVAPFKMKVLLRNKAGQTTASSGNVLSYGAYSDEAQ